MNRVSKVGLIAALISVSVFYAYPVMAAKPLPVIEMSNGFPSGPHYNLNIHGKSDYTCDGTAGGNSIFVSEYGESTITYVTNRKSGVTELTALDKCAEPFDGDPAKVQIPYEAEGFFVFGVVKAKPKNGTNATESSVILSPNLVRQACNDTDPANPEFPTYTECLDDSLLALGLIVGNNVYEATDAGFVRFSDQQAKGKSKATDITDLFKYTGWVYDAALDANADGIIDINDVPGDFDGDGDIDGDDFVMWQADQALAGTATYYDNEWILNIADLVVTDQTISNDGVKLLKLRFYPVATTQYLPSTN
jgi:hypothetical protein